MFRGSLVALVTPTREDGSVDEDNLARLVDWQIGQPGSLKLLGTERPAASSS